MAVSGGDHTRKQRRAQARAGRRALQQASTARAAGRRRLWLLGAAGAAVAAVVVGVLLATKAQQGSSPPPLPPPRPSEVSGLLEGIPESGDALGKPTAPVTLQYFGDLECPICREFTLGALPQIIDRWVRAGDLRIEYRSLETATREPETFRKQQVAAYAAGAQDKAWYFIETLYHEQGEEDSGYVTESYLDDIAKQVPGLNLATWRRARAKKRYLAEVEEDAQLAARDGLNGTPAFLIGRTGGQLTVFEPATTLTDPGAFDAAIEKLIRA